MEVTLNYDRRDRIRTVTRLSTFKLGELSENAQRLRSWAAIMGVPIVGAPFITLRGGITAQVHLPIGAEYMPHPQTGIRLDAVPPGHIVSAETVNFPEVRAVAEALREEFGRDGEAIGAPEFHSANGDFSRGILYLPLPKEAANGPAFMRFVDRPPEVGADVLVAARGIEGHHRTRGATAIARRFGVRRG